MNCYSIELFKFTPKKSPIRPIDDYSPPSTSSWLENRLRIVRLVCFPRVLVVMKKTLGSLVLIVRRGRKDKL